MTSPLCRFCGKPIAKRTQTVRFGCAPSAVARRGGELRAQRPANREEAQRYVNGAIVSVRYSTRADRDGSPIPESRRNLFGGTDQTHYTESETVPRYVSEVGVWDGESYRDALFCSDAHARDFGYAAARMDRDGKPALAMPAYWEAMKQRG